MEAKELRIGNWALNPSNGGYTIISIMDISDIENGYKQREPIPLTPEILEKCGATVSNDPYGGFLIKVSHSDSIRIIEKDGGFYWPLYGYTQVNVSSLHQLQNLYYALTGTELNFTP